MVVWLTTAVLGWLAAKYLLRERSGRTEALNGGVEFSTVRDLEADPLG